MTPATSFKGKRVAVFGLGGSGLATVRSLVAGGAEVLAFDDSEASVAKARAEGLPVGDLREADFSQFDSLVLAPGVPLTHPKPHWTVDKAKAAGVEIIGDIEIFCRERRAIAPDAGFVAITGTNGKSTTTALIAHIFRTAGWDVQMGGNIGTPILALQPPLSSPESLRVHVIECSSYQIDLAPSIDPEIGVLLNVSEDHLERHGTLENYASIKTRLVMGATRDAVVCYDAPWPEPSWTLAALRKRAGWDKSTWVAIVDEFPRLSRGDVHDPEIVAKDGVIYTWDPYWEKDCGAGLPDELVFIKLVDLSNIRSLRGRHNVQNALAAAGVFYCRYVRDEDFVRGFATFPGLAHRMEEIPTSDGITWINDSKATNADSAEKALASFEKVFWILGGKPKTGGIEALAPLFPRVERAYLIGEAAEDFAKTLARHDVPWAILGTVERAVEAAAADAVASPGGEPVVLFSPASASFDQYRNFEERGEAFRRAVQGLANA